MAKSKQVPIDEVTKPGWYAMAVYERGPAGYRFLGYTKPKWLTSFQEAVADVMAIETPGRMVRAWKWIDGSGWMNL